MSYVDRNMIIKRLVNGEKPKQILPDYMNKTSLRHIQRMNKDREKYKLHEGDFFIDNNRKAISYGKGTGLYYKINARVKKWLNISR